MNRLIILIMLFFFPVAQAFGYGDEVVSGRVTDEFHKPVRSVKVDLWEVNGPLFLTAKTNRHGEFKIKHPPCGTCYLELTAPFKTRLAQALVEDIPGNDDRSVLVSLKKGFLVKGRVLHDGKGLNDLVVKIYAKNHAKSHDARVYGGGATHSGLRGGFDVVITPGSKRLVILNNKYPELAKKYEADLTVSQDIRLEDIELPQGVDEGVVR